MPKASSFERLNIYLDEPELREKIKIAAARRGATLSSYCLEAIRHRLVEEGYLSAPDGRLRPRASARHVDRLRCKLGPIGMSVSDLIADGRHE